MKINKNLALLERRDIPEEDVPPLSNEQIDRMADNGEDLIVAAVERLGYVPPTVKQQRAQKQAYAARLAESRARARGPLAHALRAAGIKPFTEESVQAYKKAMLRQRFQVFERSMPASCAVFLFFGGMVVNVYIFHKLGQLVGNALGLGSFSHAFGLGTIPLLAFVLIVMSCSPDAQPLTSFQRTCAWFCCGSTLWLSYVCGPDAVEWKLFALDVYGKDIPRGVLMTVAEVRAGCPDTRFHVDALTKKPDPFLKATLGDEEYYLEVWDEPKFDGVRLA